MPRKLNSSHLLISDFSAIFPIQLLPFLKCGVRKPFFGRFRHNHSEAHVGLSQLYPTSLPRHSSRHVANLQEISCCCWKEDLAITSTIYESVASSRVFEACLIHSRGPLSRNSSATIPRLTTSWCLIPGTVRTNTFIDHRGLPLRAPINWSRSSLLTPAVHYILSWPPSILIWRYSHPIACCCLLLLHPVLRTVFKCASWAIILVAAIAASRWTNWCLSCCCVPARGTSDQVAVVQLDSDCITPGGGVCGAMTCCCGKQEEDDNEKWNVLRNI